MARATGRMDVSKGAFFHLERESAVGYRQIFHGVHSAESDIAVWFAWLDGGQFSAVANEC